MLLSRALYRYARESLQALIESLLAVGIGFATLAVPYGFDNHDLTGATWALEGAGLYWVGTRQQRWLSRAAGAALQLLAAGAFIYQRFDAHVADEALPIANARFLAALFVCLGALFVARLAYARRAQLPAFEALGLQGLIALGLTLLWAGFFLATPDPKQALNGLRFELAPAQANVLFALKVEASDDLSSWQLLTENAAVGQLSHDGQTVTRTRLALRTTHAPFLRVTWSGEVAPQFAKVSAEREHVRAESPLAPRHVTLGPAPLRDGAYRIDLGGNVPLLSAAPLLPAEEVLLRAELFVSAGADDAAARCSADRSTASRTRRRR